MIIPLAVMAVLASPSTVNQTFAGGTRFGLLMEAARTERVSERNLPARMEFFARQLIGVPYVGGTLDQRPTQEACTVTLDGLDCVTFAETVLALAHMNWNDEPTPEKLLGLVERTRYRGGRVEGYLSRLHYTSDWFADNAARGTWTNITASLPGAVPFVNRLFFMSKNAQRYSALAADSSLLPALREIERRLTSSERWLVPEADAASAEAGLRTGDIVALTDTRPGLDYAHVGLIVVVGAERRFVHASSGAKKVVLDRRLSKILGPAHTGFTAVRPH